jgi:hypothetical protein
VGQCTGKIWVPGFCTSGVRRLKVVLQKLDVFDDIANWCFHMFSFASFFERQHCSCELLLSSFFHINQHRKGLHNSFASLQCRSRNEFAGFLDLSNQLNP